MLRRIPALLATAAVALLLGALATDADSNTSLAPAGASPAPAATTLD